jgi:hypothetical protein
LTEVSLWAEASYDYDADARESALDVAGAHMASVMPFFLQSRSLRELEHRLSFAASRLGRIEDATGVPAMELAEMARRHYALLKQALQEGEDPLAWVPSASSFGSGPEKPDQHSEGPDFSGDYAEVPLGPPGGPDPSVTAPVFGRPQDPVEVTGAATTTCAACGRRLNKNTRTCKGCSLMPGECQCQSKTARLQRRADDATPFQTPPDNDSGDGSADLDPDYGGASLPVGASLRRAAGFRRAADNTAGQAGMSTIPAGVGGMPSSPDGAGSAAPPMPSPPSPGDQTSQGPDMSYAPESSTDATSLTASRCDRVADQISAVAASVRASNPHLAGSECRRVARRVVGSYLRTADATNGIMHDAPWLGNEPSGGGGGGGAREQGGGEGAGEEAGELGEAAEEAAPLVLAASRRRTA